MTIKYIEPEHCPFCGKKPINVREIYPNTEKDKYSCPNTDPKGNHNCPASGTWNNPEDWNKRHQSTEIIGLRNEIEQLRSLHIDDIIEIKRLKQQLDQYESIIRNST